MTAINYYHVIQKTKCLNCGSIHPDTNLKSSCQTIDSPSGSTMTMIYSCPRCNSDSIEYLGDWPGEELLTEVLPCNHIIQPVPSSEKSIDGERAEYLYHDEAAMKADPKENTILDWWKLDEQGQMR